MGGFTGNDKAKYFFLLLGLFFIFLFKHVSEQSNFQLLVKLVETNTFSRIHYLYIHVLFSRRCFRTKNKLLLIRFVKLKADKGWKLLADTRFKALVSRACDLFTQWIISWQWAIRSLHLRFWVLHLLTIVLIAWDTTRYPFCLSRHTSVGIVFAYQYQLIKVHMSSFTCLF